MAEKHVTMPLMLAVPPLNKCKPQQVYSEERKGKYGAPAINVNIAYRFTAGTPLPAWLWTEFVPCKIGDWQLTKAAFMWGSNLVCACFHFALGLATVVVGTSNSTGLDTPGLTVYTTDFSWDSSAGGLVPRNKEADQPLLLSWMTLWFFALSFFAHFAIVVGNWRQGLFGHESCEAREVTRFTGWYFVWLHECRQPLRWIEYSFSASLMIITIGVASGLSHVYMITFAFVLMWCTQCFGYYTEIISRPDPGSDPLDKCPRKWLIRNENPTLLVIPELPAALQRLAPHFLGYVPYLSIWVVFMHQFFSNMPEGEDEPGPPWFVYVIVIGQAIAFTTFGITQLVNQIDDNGPSWYMWGEWSYLVLSLVSKGLLGVTLIFSVFAYSSFGDAVQAAMDDKSA